MTKFEYLQAEILKLSTNSDWSKAIQEWELTDIYFSNSYQTCLCTHFPIVEICCITNQQTKVTVEVGNCCVNRFLDLPSRNIFNAVKRVQKDSSKALNEESIRFFHRKGYLTDWERNFYLDTFRKRLLTDKQKSVRVRLNKSVLRKMTPISTNSALLTSKL